VSKRQTISIGSGRCCRSHDEAVTFIQEQELERSFKKGEDNLKVMMTVESARCIMAVRPTFPKSILLANIKTSLRKSGLSHLVDRIINEIEEKGPLTTQEMVNALGFADLLRINHGRINDATGYPME
jgi:hypothetical protein